MWLPASSERGIAAHPLGAAVLLTLGCVAACSSAPARKAPTSQPLAQSTPATAAPASTVPTETLATPTVRPEVPSAARADFDRAVSFMRAGNDAQAELGFKQVALQFPQFAAPLVNVAILQRKAGQLEQAEDTLKNAVSHESGSAVAWTELGATQRMRGEFTKAAASYEQAIAADSRYAPAWRNLGVLEDLYLEDPHRALEAFEHYKQLTGEDKPVSGWIAELRQRLGMKRPAANEDGPGGRPQDKPSDGAPSQGTPPEGVPTGSPHAKPSAPGQGNAPAAGSSVAAGS